MVCVIYGPADIDLEISGYPVSDIRSAIKDMLNQPPLAIPFIAVRLWTRAMSCGRMTDWNFS